MPERPWPDSAVDPTLRESGTLDSLRAAGNWDAAVSFADVRTRRFSRFGGQPSWRVRDARRETRVLRRIAALPASARESLRVAERARQDAFHAHHTDQLAVAAEQGSRALAIQQAVLGEREAETARSAVELGHTLFELGRIPAADSLARGALPVLLESCGETHPWVAEAEQLIGWIEKNFSEAASRDDATSHYRRALRIRVLTDGPASLEVADSQQDLANLLRLQGRTREAAALLSSALETRRLRLGSHDEGVASTLSALATLHVAWGEWARATPLLREANAIRRENPQGIAPFNLSYSLNMYGAALTRSGHPAQAVPLLREAAAMRESLWIRAGDSDPGRAMFQSLSSYFELASALAQSGRDEEAFLAFERGASRWLVQRLSPEVPEAMRWHNLLTRARRALPADGALILWVPPTMPVRSGDYPRSVCVIRRTGPPRWSLIPAAVRAPGQRLSGVSLALRGLHAAGAWPMRVPTDAGLQRQLQLAWQEQFAMLEPQLEGVRELIVVMPVITQSVPVECLVDEQGRSLVDRFRVTYAPSALLYTLGRERAATHTHATRRPALLVGDAALAATDTSRLARLTHSRDEVTALAALLPSPTVLLGANANAAHLAALAATGGLARFGTLHFSTHAEADSRRPLASALVLAPDPGQPLSNSRLRASTIAVEWRLDADLVSLASCRSWIGRATMTDGAMGLSQVFLAAGAHAVLASLWPADDGATNQLMQRFYGNLARGAPRAEALREAKCWVRDWRAPDGSRPYAHPSYWAGFILLGDPG